MVSPVPTDSLPSISCYIREQTSFRYSLSASKTARTVQMLIFREAQASRSCVPTLQHRSLHLHVAKKTTTTIKTLQAAVLQASSLVRSLHLKQLVLYYHTSKTKLCSRALHGTSTALTRKAYSLEKYLQNVFLLMRQTVLWKYSVIY